MGEDDSAPKDNKGHASAVLWSLNAVRHMKNRLAELTASEEHAEEAYISAVQAVWWVCALDEQCNEHEDPGYSDRRTQDSNGRTVNGLRWLRDRHMHQLPLTTGNDKTPMFPGPPFYVSSSLFIWMPRSKIPPGDPQKDTNKYGLHDDYDELVALQKVTSPLVAAITWFDSEARVSGSLMSLATRVSPGLPEGHAINRRDP